MFPSFSRGNAWSIACERKCLIHYKSKYYNIIDTKGGVPLHKLWMFERVKRVLNFKPFWSEIGYQGLMHSGQECVVNRQSF